MTNKERILAKLGIDSLNDMQLDVEHELLTGRSDVTVLSPTGSGKTLAYLLPLVQMLDASSDEVQALVLVPGRELALQSQTVLRDMGSGLRSMALYGGRPAMEEHRKLREVRPQVVFATPGRINDHLAKHNVDASRLTYLVIDEFDKCLAMGFQEEMQQVIAQLPALRRRILLSATDAEEIPSFVSRRTVLIDWLDDEEQVNDRVSLYLVRSPQKDKLAELSRLLRTFREGSTIVFLNFRDSVERTAAYLESEGFVLSAFHGGLDQKQREAALYRFSNGSANVLVCTDLASRGLDIPDVDNIVHYHLPPGEQEYIHRVGRTARWQATGRAWFLLGPSEHMPEYITDEPEPFTLTDVPSTPTLPRMVTIYIGKGRKDKISKGDIMGFLCKTAGLSREDIGRIDVHERYSYAAVAGNMLRQALRNTRGQKIKGHKTVVEVIK